MTEPDRSATAFIADVPPGRCPVSANLGKTNAPANAYVSIMWEGGVAKTPGITKKERLRVNDYLFFSTGKDVSKSAEPAVIHTLFKRRNGDAAVGSGGVWSADK
jgi:hypothetical protein